MRKSREANLEDKSKASKQSYEDSRTAIVEVGADFHRRGWVLGTSGNFSIVLNHDPLRLAITSSGRDKGRLKPEEVLDLDAAAGRVISGDGKPSDETALHLAIARVHQPGAILHTHSVWSTLVSSAFEDQKGVSITGYEMLKGLTGVSTHEHEEWLPIIRNSQDMDSLAENVTSTLQQYPQAHGFLLLRHGLYTWGRDLAEARRHTEILEFLLEVIGRTI